MRQCLSEAEIAGFVRSAMDAEEREAAEGHARECAACAERVEGARAEVALSAVHQMPTELERASAGDGTSTGGSVDSSWTAEEAPPEGGGSIAFAAPRISLNEFLQGLSQSGLMPAAELAGVRKKSHDDPAVSTVAGLIDWLVEQHKLTRYQAELLARGQKGGLVLGNYVILDKLGQGGMGTVYKARHRRMNRLVALKVLPQALSNLPEAIARFQREVEAAARLQHPHIAAAYDADDAGGVHFLVMEYVDGPNLANYVKQRGALPLSLAVRLMAQAARGLATAHAQGVVHRDIKPANIMVNRQGVLKILDMGLARMRGAENPDLTSDVTQTGRVMGTIDYMAPEQARDAKSVDLRADIYSLGCTLYYLATGRTPAPAGSAAEKLLWHQSQILTPLSSEVPQATPRLDAALAALLRKRPEERPSSMHAVAEELEQCLRDLPAADATLLFDGLDLAAEQRSAPHSGSRYGQPTMAGNSGDTVISDSGRRSSLFVAAGAAKSRTAIYGGLAGAAALALLVAAGMWWRGGWSTAPAAADGTLLITVDRGPAEVVVDGESRGSAGTPAGSRLELKVKPGKLLVQVQREGFLTHEERVEVSRGKTAEVVATLMPVQRVPQPKPTPSPHKPYEKLLAWVMQNRGQVVALTGGGEPVLLMAGNPPPPQPLEIMGIKLDGTGVSDGELAELAAVPGLRELSLANTRISDRGVERLLPLRQLSSLNLSRTGVSNAGLQTVSRLTELTELNLERTAVSDPGMARLATLPKLERLFLSDTRVTDAGLEQLRQTKSLRLLTAHGTMLTEAGHTLLKAALPELEITWDGADVERATALKLLERGAVLAVVDRAGQRHDGVRSIENLPAGRVSIREANLGASGNFGDDDLKSIGVLPEIESLTLAGTRIGAVGLAKLHGLTTLLKIDLGALPLPPAAVEQLQTSLPRCQVLVRKQADEEVARQVLAAGGRVSIFTERNELVRDVDVSAKLPTGKYSLRAVNLDEASTIDDEALEKVGELQFLESLFLANTAITDVGVELIATCKSLTELRLSGTKVSAAGIAPLATLPRLKRLYLAQTVIGGEGVRQVGELAGLTHLSLGEVTLADDDLAALKRLQQLEWLDIAGTALTDAALPHLQRLGKLRELDIRSTGLVDAAREELSAELGPNCRLIADPLDPQRLAARWLVENSAAVSLESGQLTSVQSLPRGACQVVAVDLAELTQLRRDDIKTQLAACRDIVSLNLSDTQLREQDLAFLQDMPLLRSLRLAKLGLSDQALALLEGHQALEILDLSGNRISGRGLRHLAAARGLKQLLLNNTAVGDSHLASLAQFPQLEALDVSAGDNLSDAALPSIVGLSGLKSLGLRRAKITDAALEELAKLTELDRLDLEGTQIGDAGVAHLGGLKKLRNLGLSNTQVTDGATATLSKMKQLLNLNLTRTTVSADAIRQLQAELKGCFISGPALAPRDPAGFGTFDLTDPAAGRAAFR